MSKKAKQRMNGLGFSRIQSPSSINTYRQCPRKYFYQYIMELEGKPSIHLVRGKIAHSVLEDFFKLNTLHLSEKNFDFELKILMHELLSMHWEKSEEDLTKVGISDYDTDFFIEETKDMLQFWLLDFLERIKVEMKNKSFPEAFRKLVPRTEEHFVSQHIGVQGYIDAIHEDHDTGKIKIIDYKTSKRDHISDEYRLQLAIYALLYHEKYDRYPEQVGLFFFKHGERMINVDESLLEFARTEVEKVHRGTKSAEIKNYPKSKSGLCKWSSGQCDFFCQCNMD